MVLPLWGELRFDEPTQEVQARFDQTEATCLFRFTNRGEQVEEIVRYESSCACLKVEVADGKRRYAPGESGMIRAVFDLGNATGKVEKNVHLWLRGDPATEPSVKLTAKLLIPELVRIEPKTVRWDVDAERLPEPRVISIEMNHEKPIRIRSAEASTEKFEVEVRELEAGSSYELVVTPESLKVPALGVIYIRTDCELERFALQRAFAVVRKPLKP
jgi:hypothetical protein